MFFVFPLYSNKKDQPQFPTIPWGHGEVKLKFVVVFRILQLLQLLRLLLRRWEEEEEEEVKEKDKEAEGKESEGKERKQNGHTAICFKR